MNGFKYNTTINKYICNLVNKLNKIDDNSNNHKCHSIINEKIRTNLFLIATATHYERNLMYKNIINIYIYIWGN